MSAPKRVEGPKNYCDGCNDYVYPEGAPVVRLVEGGGDYEYPTEPVHLCFRCVKAALDELTKPDDPRSDSAPTKEEP